MMHSLLVLLGLIVLALTTAGQENHAETLREFSYIVARLLRSAGESNFAACCTPMTCGSGSLRATS